MFVDVDCEYTNKPVVKLITNSGSHKMNLFVYDLVTPTAII